MHPAPDARSRHPMNWWLHLAGAPCRDAWEIWISSSCHRGKHIEFMRSLHDSGWWYIDEIWWDMLYIVTIVMLQVSQFLIFVIFLYDLSTWISTCLLLECEYEFLCRASSFATQGLLDLSKVLGQLQCAASWDLTKIHQAEYEMKYKVPDHPLQTLLTTQITFQYELSLDELSNYIIISTRIQNPGLKRLKRPKT